MAVRILLKSYGTGLREKLDNVINKKLDELIENCSTQLQQLHDRMDNFDLQFSNMQNELIEGACQ